MQNYIVLGLAALAQLGACHMEMSDPPAFRSKSNPNAKDKVDYSMTSPISAAQFPCKGYLSDLGTPAGASVATWAPGSSQSFTIVGGASHGGGSCQASLSYDKGKTFTVIQSVVGGCPVSGQKVPFTVPADAPAGEVVFAWSWMNNIGNREYYMNCAAVTIGAAKSKKAKRASVAFKSRPGIFVANLGNGCTVKDGTDVIFPDPGPDVTGKTGNSADTLTGTCSAVAGNGGDTGSGSGSGSGAPASSDGGSPPASTLATSASPASPATSSLPGGVFATTAPVAAPSGGSSSPSSGDTGSSPAPTSADSGSSPTPSAGGNETSPSTPTSAPAPPTSGGGAGSQTGACTNEGAYNCLDGTSFQRCASGTWSVAMPVAAGTKCTPGTSDTLVIGFANSKRFGKRSVRFAKARGD